jgi:hypothetical protein
MQISATIRAALSASDRRLAGLAGLVAQQTLNPRFGEAVLPTPRHRPADADALSNPLNRPASAEASTMRARSTCLCRQLRSTTIARSRSRSEALAITHNI